MRDAELSSLTQSYTDSGSYTNDRRQGWHYDASGNLTDDQTRRYVFDAAGRMHSFDFGEQSYTYDGDGQVARVARLAPTWTTTYNLRSTVMGGAIVSQLTPTASAPNDRQDLIYAGGELLAVRTVARSFGGDDAQYFSWEHSDPAGTTVQRTGAGGVFAEPTVQLDPLGASVGSEDPASYGEPPPEPDETSLLEPAYGNPRRPGIGCVDNGLPTDCAQLLADVQGRAWARFDQPDPYGGSYDLSDPQTFNRTRRRTTIRQLH